MKPFSFTLLLAAACSLASALGFGQSTTDASEQIDPLLDAYFEVQTALAQDDLGAARKAAGELSAAAGAEEMEKAFPQASGLDKAAETISAASTIDAARQAFHTASKEMTALLQAAGTTGDGSVYRVHCPMAFNNTGADWLQNSKTIANPYFGASMLKCGWVKEELGAEQP